VQAQRTWLLNSIGGLLGNVLASIGLLLGNWCLCFSRAYNQFVFVWDFARVAILLLEHLAFCVLTYSTSKGFWFVVE